VNCLRTGTPYLPALQALFSSFRNSCYYPLQQSLPLSFSFVSTPVLQFQPSVAFAIKLSFSCLRAPPSPHISTMPVALVAKGKDISGLILLITRLAMTPSQTCTCSSDLLESRHPHSRLAPRRSQPRPLRKQPPDSRLDR